MGLSNRQRWRNVFKLPLAFALTEEIKSKCRNGLLVQHPRQCLVRCAVFAREKAVAEDADGGGRLVGTTKDRRDAMASLVVKRQRLFHAEAL
jgi:hypothetical protein